MNSQCIRFLLVVSVLALTFVAGAKGQQRERQSGADAYQLSPRDLISFSVLNEPDASNEQRIDEQGRIRVPYLGTMRISGLTVRHAEQAIEQTYKEHEIYTNPQVTLRVVDYSLKEVSVLGQVNDPGKVTFPIEANRLDIRDVISQAGGFTNIARSRQVLVTRQLRRGEQIQKVNVDRMLKGSSDSSSTFYVYPGDVIFVPERFF